ncbi:hypothetical protein IEQ_04885 [Bacillus cereus BAG6X1-2]|nr:hypothetical protein IEQ_04885 [Bacillus cereus BAG6X1-2]
MTLEKVSKMITQQFGIANKKEKTQGTALISYQIKHLFQQHYSAMLEEMHKVQQANFLEMEKRLGNRIDQRN